MLSRGPDKNPVTDRTYTYRFAYTSTAFHHPVLEAIEYFPFFTDSRGPIIAKWRIVETRRG